VGGVDGSDNGTVEGNPDGVEVGKPVGYTVGSSVGSKCEVIFVINYRAAHEYSYNIYQT